MNYSKYKIFSLSLIAFSGLNVIAYAQGDTKSHISSDKIFIITYPADWKENKIESAAAEFCINAPGAGILNPCMIKMEINKMAEGYENADIHKIAEVELKMWKAQPAQNMNLDLLSSKFQVINDHEWWILNGKLSKGNKDYFTDTYKTIHNKKTYVFAYFSNEKNYEKNKSAAEKIITSVEFLTKTTETAAETAKSTTTEIRYDNSSDDRVSNSVPVIADKPLWLITSATGWIKNAEGQWLSGKNKIQRHHMSALGDTSTWNKGINATGRDNFIRMEAREVKIGNKIFIVIIKSMLDGQNRYANVASTWQPAMRSKYFVIQKNKTLASPGSENDGSVEYEMQIYFNGYVEYNRDYLRNIALKISEEDYKEPRMKELGSTARLYLYYKELNDGKKCRFVFPPATGDVNNPFEPTPLNWDFVYPPIGFSDYYYECDKSTMKELLNVIGKK